MGAPGPLAPKTEVSPGPVTHTANTARPGVAVGSLPLVGRRLSHGRHWILTPNTAWQREAGIPTPYPTAFFVNTEVGAARQRVVGPHSGHG